MSEQPTVRIRRPGKPVQEFTVSRRWEDYDAGLVYVDVRPIFILRALEAVRRVARTIHVSR